MKTCDGCGGTSGVKTYRSENPVDLCVYCANSSAGSAHQYPSNYGDSGTVMIAMAAMFNQLEQRLKKGNRK